MDTRSEWIPRRDFLEELPMSDSTERRRRTGGGDWPPHIRIGAKIYYRRAAVDDWIRRSVLTPVEKGTSNAG